MGGDLWGNDDINFLGGHSGIMNRRGFVHNGPVFSSVVREGPISADIVVGGAKGAARRVFAPPLWHLVSLLTQVWLVEWEMFRSKGCLPKVLRLFFS